MLWGFNDTIYKLQYLFTLFNSETPLQEGISSEIQNLSIEQGYLQIFHEINEWIDEWMNGLYVTFVHMEAKLVQTNLMKVSWNSWSSAHTGH